MNLREKLHKWLFPEQHRTMKDAESQREASWRKWSDEHEAFKAYRARQPNPSNADLMRESLGLMKLDFVNAQPDGLPRHFLDIDDVPKRTLYVSQLNEIH